MRYTTVLFDLDGTLTRSETGITRSVLYAAEKMGYSGYTAEQLKCFIGPPLYASFREVYGMSGEEAEQAQVYYRERFSTIGWAENEVYEGIAPMLRSLCKNGVRCAIVTAKPQEFAEKIARRFGLTPFLADVIGPGFDNRHKSKAELVRRAVEQLGGVPVMIGDRCYDVEGARANGVDSVGVAYGYGTEQELRDAGATHIARTVKELEAILLGDAPRARGVFLSMEGVDGCGKTTQREALVRHMREMGWPVTKTREPGGDEVAEKIRNLVLDPENAALCDEAEAYLYAASRAQDVRAVIRPALADGRAVVCDRFVDSSISYQGGGRALGLDAVAQLNALAVGGTLPDATIYLRMTPEAALARRLNASEPDRMELEHEAFFRRTYEGYETLRMQHAKRFLTVDATRSIEEVTAQMLAAVDVFLAGFEG